MNFEFTEEQEMIRQAARDYAQRELIKDVLERDENATFPTQHVKALGELGFLGMMTNPKWGGSGMDTVSYVLALTELAKVDASVAVIMSVNNSLVNHGLEAYGNDFQKEKYLVPLANGTSIGAFLLSEPEAGSDATKQKTTAEDKGDYYLINGTKNWITNANSASTYLVMAMTYPEKGHKGINAFIVEKNSPGISLGPHENKMGMRSSDTHSVMFTDVKVPKENRIGEDGFGFKFAMNLLNGGRIGIASQATGIAWGAMDLALKYSQERKSFGTEIFNHQSVAFKLADMAMEIELARNLLYKACWLKDNKKPFAKEAAMSKLYCSEVARRVADEAVQIHGGYGLMKDYPIERFYRDQRLLQIGEGTSEIQRLVISRYIGC